MGTGILHYSQLSSSEQSLLSEEIDCSLESIADYKEALWWWLGLLLSCIVQYFVIVALSAALLVVIKRGCSQRKCTQKLSASSPLLDVVEYEDVNDDNDFAHQQNTEDFLPCMKDGTGDPMLELYNETYTSLLGCSIILIILSTITVIGRLISRRISAANFWWDDALTIISLLNSYAVHIFAFIEVHNGVGRHVDTVARNQTRVMLQMIYASKFHYLFGISTIKLAVLLFYLRIFEARKGFKNIIYATGALVISWFLAQTFAGIFRCSPINAAWLFDAVYRKRHCIQTSAWLISMSVFNILLEVWILILPLFFVWTLQLSPRRKAGLSGIFLLGAFTIGASVAMTYSVFSVDLFDITWSTTTEVFWSIVEVSVGVICACLPTLPPVLGLLGRKFLETIACWSRRTDEIKDSCYSEASARQKGETTPSSNLSTAPLRLTLGNASWQALDYKGFGHDNAFKEVGISHAVP